MNRRDFLKEICVGTILGASGELLRGALSANTMASAASTGRSSREGGMIYRDLGQTGEKVSIIGLGGFHIGMQDREAESIRLIRAAIDRGVTFMDNSWDYNNGESEKRMGKALKDGYRNRVFLMTKFDGQTKKAASRQIDESLKRLQVDHLDLIQFHEIIRTGDPERIFADDGAWRAALDARQAGKVRFIGFTGHKDPDIHLKMIETGRDHDFRFDTVQMPLNVMDAHFRSFERKVLPVLVKEKIGVLGMKSMGDGIILKSGKVKPVECLHYAMSLPISVVITGIDRMEILDQALETVRTFKPMSKAEIASLLSRTKEAAGRGEYELFKTSQEFDSTARNPEWLG